MVDPVHKREIFIRNCFEERMLNIITSSRLRTYSPEEIIIFEGTFQKTLFQLTKGRVRVEKGTGIDHVFLTTLPSGSVRRVPGAQG